MNQLPRLRHNCETFILNVKWATAKTQTMSYKYFSISSNKILNEGTTYTTIPLVEQEYVPAKVLLPDRGSKLWLEFIRNTVLNLIWIYTVGVIAFFVTMYSASADAGSGSFLRNHFSMSMIFLFLISLSCSLVLTISMMWCPQICSRCLPMTDQEYEHLVHLKPPSLEGVNNTLDKDINQRNIQRSYSLENTPSFHTVAAAR